NLASRFVVELQLLIAELQHIADDGDAPAFDVRLFEERERARDGVWIRVVRVVVERRAFPRNDDAAMRRRFELGDAALDALPRDADGSRRGDRGEKILEIVPAGQRELEGVPLHGEARAEETALADVGAAELRIVIDAVR